MPPCRRAADMPRAGEQTRFLVYYDATDRVKRDSRRGAAWRGLGRALSGSRTDRARATKTRAGFPVVPLIFKVLAIPRRRSVRSRGADSLARPRFPFVSLDIPPVRRAQATRTNALYRLQTRSYYGGSRFTIGCHRQEHGTTPRTCARTIREKI